MMGANNTSAVFLATSTVWRLRGLQALGVAALVLCGVALARPQCGLAAAAAGANGIAMYLVVDVSKSMSAWDLEKEAEGKSRLEIAKKAFREFVQGEGEFGAVGEGDRIGLVAFARYPEVVSSLTPDHDKVLSLLGPVESVVLPEDNGTAIGEAAALSLERLSKAPAARSKAVIILTDGINNAGLTEPLEAAQIGKALGIKIYTIGVGSNEGTALIARRTHDGRQVVHRIPVSIDDRTLRRVAHVTGGQYFRATGSEAVSQTLKEIYSAIMDSSESPEDLSPHEAEARLHEIGQRARMVARQREEWRNGRRKDHEEQAAENRAESRQPTAGESTVDKAGDRQVESPRTRVPDKGPVWDEPLGCRYVVLPPHGRPELVDKLEGEIVNPPDSVRGVIELAKSWRPLNFVFDLNSCALDVFDDRDPFPWCTAPIGMSAQRDPNVYVVLGGRQFADVAINNPRLGAFILGTWIKCLGAAGVIWAEEDALEPWEADLLRRLEIPEDMQREYGFPPLGPADSQVRRSILTENLESLKEKLTK